METEAIWHAIERERREMADLIEALNDEQWHAPSLCNGWEVRDVAAHLTTAARIGVGAAMKGLVRARGNFNRFVNDDAMARRSMSRDDIVTELRSLADDRHHPPGTKPMDPLVDMLVHGQDITVPLDIDRAMPQDAAVAGSTHVWSKGFPFSARKRFRGYRVEATNAPFATGEGAVVRGPIEAVLLALTGRRAGVEQLTGDDTTPLAARFG
jgi:uncharacterized protein (TIGR03083 family)